jgi:hypothetical protein
MWYTLNMIINLFKTLDQIQQFSHDTRVGAKTEHLVKLGNHILLNKRVITHKYIYIYICGCGTLVKNIFSTFL